jgi:hypothetical protein
VATFGGFKARAHGRSDRPFPMRPSLPGMNLITELKWLHEFNNKKRLEGDTAFFKVLTKF